MTRRNRPVVMRPLSGVALDDAERNLRHMRRSWDARRLRRHHIVGRVNDQGKPRGTRPRRWLCLAVVVASGLVTAGCLTADQGLVSSTLSNGHDLYLQAYSIPCCGVLAVGANANVPSGTAGTLDVTGPVSWQCTGVFDSHPPLGDPETPWADLPDFTVSVNGAGWSNLDFYGPGGKYQIRLTLAAPSGSISESVTSTGATTDVSGSFGGADGLPSPDCTQSPAPSPAA